MCGIAGLIYKNKKVDCDAFNHMRDTLAHRGPDDAASEFLEQGRAALGHRRLSFLDLSEAGRQPMCNEDGKVWIVFNGEIYNYVELAAELKRSGHTFKTTSDTEVIIHGYEQWGHQVVDHLKGMFAFCILDQNKRELFLSRDRFGIKPLYYRLTSNTLVFASELKAIVAEPGYKPEVDYCSVADYLVYRYVPSPRTIWQGIAKLEPAHTMTVNLNTFQAEIRQYWSLPDVKRTAPSDIVERYGKALSESVRIHARADVPIGSFLSGGYDSSAVVACLTDAGYKPETFTIGFTEWNDSEHARAQETAQHFGVPCFDEIADASSMDLLDVMPDVYDEPIADISILPTWMVSRLAATHVKAVMSGEGADEMLGGYWWEKKAFAETPVPGRKQRLLEMLGKRTPTQDLIPFYADAMAMGRFDREELQKALSPRLHEFINDDPDWFYRKHFHQHLSPLKATQYMDARCFMGELVLVKIDRASMAHSLEVRVPFLDHELVEMVFRAPEHAMFRPDTTKYLLHENIKDRVPASILNRPKQGFTGPDDYYKDLSRYRAILTNCTLVEHEVVSAEYIHSLFEQEDFWRMWKLVVLEKWFQRWTR